MQETDNDIIREFVIESSENLARLDREMMELELRLGDAALPGSIFRTTHTVKGTCGFLGFAVLERVTTPKTSSARFETANTRFLPNLFL